MRSALIAMLIATPAIAAMGGSKGKTGKAVAPISDAAGKAIGNATITETGHGLKLTVKLKGAPAGERALHLHTAGKCEGPAFTTAGPHWNPAGKQHGKDNPAGPHAGDAPNITVMPNGKGMLTWESHGGNLAGILDADGSAVIVHAKPDDYRTDPTGNAGDRIACGVFARK
jgi:superoxide dismutase, Cu-Zn family